MKDYYLGIVPADYAARSHGQTAYFKKDVLAKSNATEDLSLFNKYKKSYTDVEDYEKVLSYKDIKKGNKGNNIFNDALESSVDDKYRFSGDTVLKDATSSNNGVKYGKSEGSKEDSALEFAQEYIKLTDKRGFLGIFKGDGKLSVKEMEKHYKEDGFDVPDKTFKYQGMNPIDIADSVNFFDVLGKKGKEGQDGALDESEIAASMLFADGAYVDDKGVLHTEKCDGTITKDESIKMNDSILNDKEGTRSKLTDLALALKKIFPK